MLDSFPIINGLFFYNDSIIVGGDTGYLAC